MSPLKSSDCVVISPYLIPDALKRRKVVNVGDGFILRAVERLLGPIPVDRLFSTREPLPASGVQLLERSRALVSAGANQLNDRYTVLPNMTAAQVRQLSCPIVLIGIGIHGLAGETTGMSESAKAVMREIHKRVAYSSWRCPLTIAYLARELPELSPQMLMTGCPVIYDRPLLEGVPFKCEKNSIAVTATERGEFFEREVATLSFVSSQFPKSRRYFVVHQNFVPPHPLEALKHRMWPFADSRPAVELRRAARALGFTIVIPKSADDAAAFYETMDLHVGSRLHAHLFFLSRAKWSFLTYVDERMTGIAQAFGFPICEPSALIDHLGFDFELVRGRAQEHFETMKRFIASLETIGACSSQPSCSADRR